MAEADAAEREPAHRHGFALGADGIGQIDQAGHEESERRFGGQHALEARDDEGGHGTAEQADDEPGQAVARAAQRRSFERVAGLVGFVADAGQVVQILHMLAAQDAQQRGSADDAEQAAFAVGDRQRRQVMVQRQRRHMLLLGLEAHARQLAVRDAVQALVVGQGQQLAERHGAEQFLLAIDDAKHVGMVGLEPRLVLHPLRAQRTGGLLAPRHQRGRLHHLQGGPGAGQGRIHAISSTSASARRGVGASVSSGRPKRSSSCTLPAWPTHSCSLGRSAATWIGWFR